MLKFLRLVHPGIWVLWLLCSCSQTRQEYLIVSLNAQNLFDGVHQGGEYKEFDPSHSDWGPAPYWQRLERLATVLRSVDEKGPDLLVLLEIENATVLADLVGRYFSASGYKGYFAGLAGKPPGIGVLTRLPVTSRQQLGVGSRLALRPVLELRVKTVEGDLVLFAGHWKSKLGQNKHGIDWGETARRSAAEAVRARAGELLAAEPELPLILAGDLNEAVGSASDALVDADTQAVPSFAGLGVTSVLSDQAMPRVKNTDLLAGSRWYSPWKQSGLDGSYYIKGHWEKIDHFLLGGALLQGNARLKPSGFGVVRTSTNANGEGRPLRYMPNTKKGFSDHLPILLRLVPAKEVAKAPPAKAP